MADIVGNNVPVFFLQDAIQFPDLIHAVKPSPDNEIPQAATAHDTAWDFFSQQPSSLHTLFWAMAGNGIPRSYRHMDGFGVHTFRFVNDQGKTKLIKWFWKTKQGKASLVPESIGLRKQWSLSESCCNASLRSELMRILVRRLPRKMPRCQHHRGWSLLKMRAVGVAGFAR